MIIIVCSILFIFILLRVFIKEEKITEQRYAGIRTGFASFVGNREIQADYGRISESRAGLLVALADGLGKNTLGKVSAHIAVDTVLSFYNSYELITNPFYFFRRAFNQANFEVLKVLEGRNGGASLAAVFVSKGELLYALAGDVKVALFRKGELISLSEGHTLGVLAGQAYTKGKMTKQQALWSMKEKRLWNYVGQDGFKEIEMIDVPIHLKPYDKIVVMSKGVYENIPWKEIEDNLMKSSISPKETAEKIMEQLMGQEDMDKDNSSIYIIEV